MTTPKKPSATKKTSAALTNLALDKARAALRDEDIQRLLVANAKVIADQFKRWRSEHKEEPSRLGGKFGQRRLVQRIENLDDTIGLLTAGRPELAEAMAPVSEAVVQLRVAAEIAGRLPVVKRKQAQFRLDKEIARFETMLFEAALPN